MFGIEIIEVAFGLAFVYFTVSTVCSGIVEAFSQIFNYRAKHLENGIRQFLNGGAGEDNGLTKLIYDHPAVSSKIENIINKREYIHAKQFSAALFDILAPDDREVGSAVVNRMKSQIGNTMTDPKIQAQLNRFVGALRGDTVGDLKDLLDDYFENSESKTKVDELLRMFKPDAKLNDWPPESTKDAKQEKLGFVLKDKLLKLDIRDEDKGVIQELLDAMLTEGSRIMKVKELIFLHLPKEKADELVKKLDSIFNSEKVAAFRRNLAEKIEHNHLQKMLLEKIEKAEAKVEKVREEIENWFDDSMNDVSTWYRQNARLVIFLLSIVVTIGFNIDTLDLAKRFWSDNDIRAAIVQSADDIVLKGNSTQPNPAPLALQQVPPPDDGGIGTGGDSTAANTGTNPERDPDPTTVTGAGDQLPPPDLKKTAAEIKAEIEKLEALPVGFGLLITDWEEVRKEDTFSQVVFFLYKLLGWIMTIAAASLGAPFWFDLLRSLANVRQWLGGGNKSAPQPAEASE